MKSMLWEVLGKKSFSEETESTRELLAFPSGSGENMGFGNRC